MRSWFTVLLLAIISCGAREHPLNAPMVVYASFQVEPSALVMESIREELASIMSPIGIRFEWRSLSNALDDEPAVELVMIHFKGHCDPSAITPIYRDLSPLGLTHVSDHVILPFSDIDCDRIHSFIQRDLLIRRAGEREKTLGRAIARVLSHELYHIFANTLGHGSCGLGKSTYRASELVSNDFHFEKRDLIAVRKGKILTNLENPANLMNAATARPEAPRKSGPL